MRFFRSARIRPIRTLAVSRRIRGAGRECCTGSVADSIAVTDTTSVGDDRFRRHVV
jgi:hypothetical protein